jgi:selenocysteine lyase/cysteine desulfurase
VPLCPIVITPQIDKPNIEIRFRDFYAKRLIEDLGLDKQGGVVRVTMLHYNTIEEVDIPYMWNIWRVETWDAL